MKVHLMLPENAQAPQNLLILARDAAKADLELNIILDNTTFGFGLAFRATDWLKFNLGYFHSLYNDWEEKVEYGKNTYKRESRGVGVGIDLDI